MEEITLLELFEWAQDPTHLCAEQPIIPSSAFEELSLEASAYKEVTKTSEEILELFNEQSKRFSACGANNSEKWGVLRKNPKIGWQYLIDLITVV